MKKYIKQARDEGLDWQTALIEDAQTDIKELLSKAIVFGWAWAAVNAAVQKIVAQTDDIEIEELKQRARLSLLAFATVQWRLLKTASQETDFSILRQVSAAAKNTSKTAFSELEKTLKARGKWWTVAQPLDEWSQTYMKKVRKAFDDLARSTAKDDYGSNVSLRNIAEMTVRYDRQLNAVAELKARGVRLVWTSAHANCSKRCEPYQGRLWSLDGTYGEIDGYKYEPLENATEIYYTTRSGKRYRNGIIYGFNCRHRLIPYERGNKPIEVPANIVKKQRRINNTQRAMERRVRYYENQAAVYKGIDDKYAATCKRDARKAYDEYVRYSKKNNVAYYPSRTKTYGMENASA